MVLQKRALRIICSTSYQAHTAQLFLDLAILKIEQIHECLMGATMYRTKNKLMQFSQYGISIQNVHEQYTRTSSILLISYARTNYRKFAVRLRGPVVWNDIPIVIRELPTLYSLKKMLDGIFTK